jgi:hypothetical protein
MTTSALKEAIASAGGIQKFNNRFNEYCKNDQFIHDNFIDLLQKYNDKWIVVYNGKLQLYSKNWQTVMSKVKKNGFPSEEVAIQFISDKPREMIL